MKNIFPTCLIIFFTSSYLFAQTIPLENIQSRNDSKRLHLQQQMLKQNKGYLHQDELKSLYLRPSPLDSLMMLRMTQNKKQKSKTLNKTTHPQSDMYVIDTAIVFSAIDTSRHLYSYDLNGKMIEDLWQGWSNNQWGKGSRSTYTYNANGNLLVELNEKWGINKNQWVKGSRCTYTYDANGNALTSLYEWGVSNEWVNRERYTWTFDANENMLTSLYEWWSNNQWVNGSRYTYTYEVTGKKLSERWDLWSNNQWVNEYRLTYTYDYTYSEFGDLYTTLNERFENNQWVNRGLETYTYDANGNMLTDLCEVWEYGQWGNNKWVNYRRDTYTYDANGNLLTDLIEGWSGVWWANFRRTYTYDSKGNMLTYLYENSDGVSWVNEWRDTWNYDANGNLFTYLYESWSNNQWVNGWRYTYKYFQNTLWSAAVYETWSDSSWCSDSKVDFLLTITDDLSYSFYGSKVNLTYKSLITNVNKNDGGIAKEYSLSQNYPNPFNPSTTIRYSLPSSVNVKLAVYDLLGREIALLVNEEQSAGWKEVHWDASNFASGMYLVRMQAGSFNETKKSMLMK